MSTFIIPDIHNKVGIAQSIIDRFITPEDKIIFLGDYFDSYGDNATNAATTAYWVNRIADRPNTKLLLGNHDIGYTFPKHHSFYCPGNTREKSKRINDIISRSKWDNYFDLVYFDKGWVFSHAGFHPRYASHPVKGASQKYIAKQCDDALKNAAAQLHHPLFHYGTRLGIPGPGGCNWLHWDDFEPIPGINQVVGHTSMVGGAYSDGGIFAGHYLQVPTVKWMDKDYGIHDCSLDEFNGWDLAVSVNINCDTGLKCILKIEDDPVLGKITLIKI